MKKIFSPVMLIVAALAAVLYPGAVRAAGPDLFSGDTKIYGGTPAVLEPNVLIIIDNSGSMADTVPAGGGSVYDNTITYAPIYNCTDSSNFSGSICATNTVYDSSYNYFNANVNNITTSCGSPAKNPRSIFQANGYYSGPKLNSNGTCNGSSTTVTYYLGNYINWLYDASNTNLPKVDIATTVMSNLVQATSGVRFGLMTYLHTNATKNTITKNNNSKSCTGTIAATQKKITVLSMNALNTSNMVVGAAVSGTYIASGSVIVSIDSSSQITLSKNTTNTSTKTNQSLTFTWTSYDPGTDTFNTGEGATFLSSVPTGTLPSYVTTIKDMDAIFSGSYTNRRALSDTIQTLSASGDTPLAESLFEALRYFQGGAPAFGSTVGVSSGGTYTSPIQYGCQQNYIILVTDGMSTADDNSVLGSICTNGDCDGDGREPDNTTTQTIATNETYTTAYWHSLDDVAKYLYVNDLRSDISGTQNVTVFTVGFGLTGADADAVALLTRAADINHGHGAYYLASSAQGLAKALGGIMGSIFSVNTSFVSPVVPVSPENKTYSGERIYMGFFMPEAGPFWSGNLKKYRLDPYTSPTNGSVVLDASAVFDLNGNLANYVDLDNNRLDDRDGTPLPSTAVNGAFRSGSKSYWSTLADGGEVEMGGVGALLLSRDYSITCQTCDIQGTSRKIYTYLGTNTDLTQSVNAFSTMNTSLTATVLGLPGAVISSATTTDVKTFINYFHGFNTYLDETSKAITDKRSWILGDILHSKPLVITYHVFDYSHPNEANETDPSLNKNMIYVGANDGMLHAFNDYDGSEAWAFIPPDVLPNLQYLRGNSHDYFVDSTVSSYIYQTDPKAASISPAAGDSVAIVVGLRRGGGRDSEPGTGYYYALDVTNPNAPKFLWSISNTTRWSGTVKTATTDFSDMGEAWSEPKIEKIKVGSTNKIAVFIGGGYDNCNEDARFGATQSFTGSCVSAISTPDGGLDAGGLPITSSPASTAVTSFTSSQYKGRAIYAVELASLNTPTPSPNFGNGGSKIWGYTIANSPPLEYSMVGELFAIDANQDGYVDFLYGGDSGGNLWRINVQNTDTTKWTVTKIFSSNPGYTGDPGAGVASVADNTKGRKILFKPAGAVDKNGLVRIFFGTGDREHPLNQAVIDRFYGLIDKGQTTAVTEQELLDVSTDLIQNGTYSQVTTMKSLLDQASMPSDSTYYGWYMRIYGAEHNDTTSYQGEKITASPLLQNGALYFTTYSPITAVTTTDPCQMGNLGTARLYAVDFYSGMAALNLDTSNDTLIPQWAKNPNAHDSAGHVLQRTDRTLNVGSGLLPPPPPNGPMGCNGGLCKFDKKPGGEVMPLYWRQR